MNIPVAIDRARSRLQAALPGPEPSFGTLWAYARHSGNRGPPRRNALVVQGTVTTPDGARWFLMEIDPDTGDELDFVLDVVNGGEMAPDDGDSHPEAA